MGALSSFREWAFRYFRLEVERIVEDAVRFANPSGFSFVSARVGREALPPLATVSHVAFTEPSGRIVKVVRLSRDYQLVHGDTLRLYLSLECDGPPSPHLGTVRTDG